MRHEKKLIVNGNAILPGHASQILLLVEDGKIKMLLDEGMDVPANCEVIDVLGETVIPGMTDSHDHAADPGPYNFREDWYCGSCSAASGGITIICDMPLPSEPVTTDWPGFELKKGTAERRSIVDFALRGGLIPPSIKDMKEMHDLGCIGFKGFMCFVIDVYPRITDGCLVDGMWTAASFDGLIAPHTESAEAADLGCQHYSRIWYEGEACSDNARPQWTEYDATQKTALFTKTTGVRSEICHTIISQGVELLRNAEKEGTRAYVETCPHYPIFDRDVLRERKSFAKHTPPFRSREDAGKMREYVMDETIDVIGSDHGLYTDEEEVRASNLWKKPCGFRCNDVMSAAMISRGVDHRGLSWKKLTDLASANVARVLGLCPRKGNLLLGADMDFIFIDPNKNWAYDGSKSFSKAKSAKGPYQGMESKGRVADAHVRSRRAHGDGKILCQAKYEAFIKYGT